MSNTAQPQNTTETADPILAQCLEQPVHEWPANLMMVLIARIEDAFQDERKSSMEALHGQLDQLLTHVFKNAPDDVRTAVLSSQGNRAIRIAHLLGQLSFAQELAATVTQHRPDDAFFEVFQDPQMMSILRHLIGNPSSKADIARKNGLLGMVVDLKMKELLAKKLVDFRMASTPGTGSYAEYFLTPAAETAIAAA